MRAQRELEERLFKEEQEKIAKQRKLEEEIMKKK